MGLTVPNWGSNLAQKPKTPQTRGVSVNSSRSMIEDKTLMDARLAWWSDKFAPNDAQLKQLFQTAKKAHIGLWSDANPVPPWIFRNGARSTQAEILKSK